MPRERKCVQADQDAHAGDVGEDEAGGPEGNQGALASTSGQ